MNNEKMDILYNMINLVIKQNKAFNEMMNSLNDRVNILYRLWERIENILRKQEYLNKMIFNYYLEKDNIGNIVKKKKKKKEWEPGKSGNPKGRPQLIKKGNN